MQFYANSTERMQVNTGGVDVTGDFVASGNVTAYSDQRLKDNIQTIDNALNKVESMRGVTFTKDGELSSGVIAQELEQIHETSHQHSCSHLRSSWQCSN